MNALIKLKSTPIPLPYVQAIYLAILAYAIGCGVSGYATLKQATLYWGYDPSDWFWHETLLSLGPFLFVIGMCIWMDVSLAFTRPFDNTSNGGLKFETMVSGAIKVAHELSFANIETQLKASSKSDSSMIDLDHEQKKETPNLQM